MKSPFVRIASRYFTRFVIQVSIATTISFLVTFVALVTKLQTDRPGLLFSLVLPVAVATTTGTDIVLIQMGLTAPIRRSRSKTADMDFQLAVDAAVTRSLQQLTQQATQNPRVSVEAVAELERLTRDRTDQL